MLFLYVIQSVAGMSYHITSILTETQISLHCQQMMRNALGNAFDPIPADKTHCSMLNREL